MTVKCVRQFKKTPKAVDSLLRARRQRTSKYNLVCSICLFTCLFLREDRETKAIDCLKFSEDAAFSALYMDCPA